MPPTLPASDDTPSDRPNSESPLDSNSVSHPPILLADLGEDEDDLNNYGYEMLSSSPEQEVVDSDNESNEEEDEPIVNPVLVYSTDPLSIECEMSGPSIEMDEDHIEIIKDVMKNVTLPKGNLPLWMDTVPDEEWKKILDDKIQEMATNKHKATDPASGGNSLKDE